MPQNFAKSPPFFFFVCTVDKNKVSRLGLPTSAIFEIINLHYRLLYIQVLSFFGEYLINWVYYYDKQCTVVKRGHTEGIERGKTCVCPCANHCVRGGLLNSVGDRIKLVTIYRQHYTGCPVNWYSLSI